MKKILVLLVVCLLGILSNNRAFAQISKCPYEYFSLRNDNASRDYFSFSVQFQQRTRLAYGTFGDLETFYKKYKDSKYITHSRENIVNHLSDGSILKSPVPFDSLNFLDFASVNQIKEVDAIAKKGEKYFINYYFNNLGCVKQKFYAYEPAIMKYLQLWCIAATQDDEGGCLHISYKFISLVR